MKVYAAKAACLILSSLDWTVVFNVIMQLVDYDKVMISWCGNFLNNFWVFLNNKNGWIYAVGHFLECHPVQHHCYFSRLWVATFIRKFYRMPLVFMYNAQLSHSRRQTFVIPSLQASVTRWLRLHSRRHDLFQVIVCVRQGICQNFSSTPETVPLYRWTCLSPKKASMSFR